MQFNANASKGGGGEKLLASTTITGNTEYHISAVDWANGIITTPTPHGIAAGATVKVAMCPDTMVLTNPTVDMPKMPIEWMKPQGVASGTLNTGLALLGIDTTTAKVVKSSDGATVLTVNSALSPDNTSIDYTKFHFEAMNGTGYTFNIPATKKVKLKMQGYAHYFDTTGPKYRYHIWNVLATDGTTITPPFIGILGIPNMNGNPSNAAGVFMQSEWTFDVTSPIGNVTTWTQLWGRRNGFTSQIDKINSEYPGAANSIISFISQLTKPATGITKIQTHSSAYCFLCNGSIVEVWDMGVQ